MILDQFGDPIKIEKKSLTNEMATFFSATGSDFDIMPDPDPVLKKRGDDAKVLEALAADDQVTMAMQLRKRKITNKRDYDYTPGQPNKGESPTKAANALCGSLTQDLAQINLKTVFNASLSAPFYGYSVFELMWGVDGGRMRLVDIQEKPREWFGFDGKGKLFFWENGQQKEVPWGKFLVVRHEPTYKNPYGLRLLSRCLFPVAFKNAGIQWAMKFLERYGMPWQVAHAPQDYDDKKRQELASQLASMVQDAVAVLPANSELTIVESKAGKSAGGFIEFLNFWNAAISKVLSCQTQSSEITGSGTYASSKTHYEVLEDVVQSDEMLVCEAMNDLAVIYVLVNGSNEYPPVFSFNEAEDHLAQAELDKKRFEVGVRFTKSHFERLGLDQNEFEIVDPTNPAQQVAVSQEPNEEAEHARGDFAEGGFTPEQQALEDLAEQQIKKAGKDLATVENRLLDCVKKAESFDELVQLLEQTWPNAGMGQMEDLLAQAMTAAQMYGFHQVIEELK